MQLRSKFIRKVLKIVAGIIILVLFGGLGILLVNSKSIKISAQDKIYIQRFLSDWHCSKAAKDVHRSFESELKFISFIQDSVLANITGEQIPHVYFGDVSYYYKNRQGICYDRAVLIEKILSYYNFKFRHVYIYFGDGAIPSVSEFFKKHITSHAALEVKTKKGWMAIGTDDNWLGIDKESKVFTYFVLRKELNLTKGFPRLQKPGKTGTNFWNVAGYNFRIIYGVYSRHGDFFTTGSSVQPGTINTGKRHFLPDYNLRMLFYNL